MTKKRAFINATEKAKNFKMVDCDFTVIGTDKPILNTRAENTQIIRPKIRVLMNKAHEHKWLWQMVVPFIVAVAAGIVVYLITR